MKSRLKPFGMTAVGLLLLAAIAAGCTPAQDLPPDQDPAQVRKDVGIPEPYQPAPTPEPELVTQ